MYPYKEILFSAPVSSTYANTGTIQNRLAQPGVRVTPRSAKRSVSVVQSVGVPVLLLYC